LKLLLRIITTLCLLPLCALANITDGQFGSNQIFDVQYSINNGVLNASNFIAPYDSNFVTVNTQPGQYFQFIDNGNGDYGLGLYNSNNTLDRVIHASGTITALGDDVIFYLGSGFFGTVITPSEGYSNGDSITANVIENPDNNTLQNYTWASLVPLAAGQVAGLNIQSVPSVQDTSLSMMRNAIALKQAFNLQSAKIAQGLTFDCTLFNQNNSCVSFMGTRADSHGFDANVGALILAYQPTSQFRFGGYIDQSMGSSSAGGLTIKRGNPGYGVFGVWSQNADGIGFQVRVAMNADKVDIETQRAAIGSAESGLGQSDIQSKGILFEVSQGFAVSTDWIARPYVGYRKTSNTRDSYTEYVSASVTAPLSYKRLTQNTETLTTGLTLGHMFSTNTVLSLTAGVEHDMHNSIDRYQVTNDDIGIVDSIDLDTNKRKTRPMASIAVNHLIDNIQRIGVMFLHRREAFESATTNSVFVQYALGF
jgi:hypothetical protein